MSEDKLVDCEYDEESKIIRLMVAVDSIDKYGSRVFGKIKKDVNSVLNGEVFHLPFRITVVIRSREKQPAEIKEML